MFYSNKSVNDFNLYLGYFFLVYYQLIVEGEELEVSGRAAVCERFVESQIESDGELEPACSCKHHS